MSNFTINDNAHELTHFILNAYEECLAVQNNIIKGLIKYYSNDEIDLNERWEVYKQTNKLLPLVSVYEFDKLFESFVDEFSILLLRNSYYSKYETLTFETLVDIIEDYIIANDDYNEISRVLSKLDVNEVKLRILNSGKKGVVFDW